MGAAQETLHAVKDAFYGLSGDGAARAVVNLSQEHELVRLLFQQPNPLGKWSLASEISDPGHLVSHRFVIHRKVPWNGHLRKWIISQDFATKRFSSRICRPINSHQNTKRLAAQKEPGERPVVIGSPHLEDVGGAPLVTCLFDNLGAKPSRELTPSSTGTDWQRSVPQPGV